MAVVKQVVRDLNLELGIRVVPTVRDDDGLALSSRNGRLSDAERSRALAIPRALATRDPTRAHALLAEAGIEPDYVAVADLDGPTLAVAARDRLDAPDRQRPPGRRAAMSTRPRTPARAAPAPGKLRLPELVELKRRGDRITMVTAYDAPAARLADEAGVELILVGDSAAMVMLGHESTLPVTLDEMVFLTRAVTRKAHRPLVIGDLPFGSYEVSDEQAVTSAIRLLKEGGADAVKLEGAGRMVSRTRAIAESNIAVMGHIGLTPQSATKLGGFRAQGRTARRGAHARTTTRSRSRTRAASRSCSRPCRRLSPPGSRPRSRSRRSGSAPAPACDGQVLVWHDLLGMYDGGAPRFVKRYADARRRDRRRRSSTTSRTSAAATFPAEQHTYSIPDAELDRFEAALGER